jgi:hypothetical protein
MAPAERLSQTKFFFFFEAQTKNSFNWDMHSLLKKKDSLFGPIRAGTRSSNLPSRPLPLGPSLDWSF